MWLSLHAVRARRDIREPVLAIVRWLYATVPFAFAWVTIAAGGEQWVLQVGFITSVTLLVMSAHLTRREAAGRIDSGRTDAERR